MQFSYKTFLKIFAFFLAKLQVEELSKSLDVIIPLEKPVRTQSKNYVNIVEPLGSLFANKSLPSNPCRVSYEFSENYLNLFFNTPPWSKVLPA